MGQPRATWTDSLRGLLAVLAASALLVLGAAAVVATSISAAAS
jgi:hypothetical protein